MKKNIRTICIILLAAVMLTFAGCAAAVSDQQEETQTEETAQEDTGDLNLRDIYGGGYYYLFTYKGEDYTAIYTYDNWCVYDSYKITSGRAMKKICQALIDEHPVHGNDYESFRTAKDMVYEWKQHNIAHAILPDDNPWKVTSGNVDFDPEDQGRSLSELYEDRTGEKFSIMEHTDDIKRYLKELVE
ncbi:MAG: hypothetical protein IJ109_07605 [Firmicutes bacterium]|nr:hypothetical protein [Bacillota bacterium]